VIVIKSGPDGRTWTVPTRKRAFLGVQLLPLTDELRGHFGVKGGIGVMISKVEKDTPAAAAGLRAGDVLVAADGSPVSSPAGLLRAIRGKKDGDPVKLEVVREGKKRTLEARLTVRETPQIDLSGLFQLSPDRGELRLEIEGDDIEIPLPPMPQIQDLREHIMKLRENDELLKQLEKEKNLEKRLRELEEKLREMEKKLQGRAAGAAADRRGA
jgi:membrane-associated protease RseP (regulator of RpoE activity)